MEEIKQENHHLRGDLLLVIVITVVLSGVLLGLVLLDNQSDIIKDLARSISSTLIK